LLLAALAGAADEPRPLPLRNRVPEGATLCLTWSADLDGIEDLRIRGHDLRVEHKKLGRPRDVHETLHTPLPAKELGIFVRLVRGRGSALVLQDPSKANGYEAVVRVVDRGKGSAPAEVEVYYGPRPPPPPPFPIPPPAAPPPDWNRRAFMPGGLFGERKGAVRKLAQGPPLFTWRGEVAEYAVLAITDKGVELLDCGLPRARTVECDAHGGPGDDYVILSACDGRGRVRVLQRMRCEEQDRVLIEIDDRDMPGAAPYRIVGHRVARDAVDGLYTPAGAEAARAAEKAGNLNEAARLWLDMATAAPSETARLWAIEKTCQLRAYPGPAANFVERASLAAHAAQEPVCDLRGTNVILAWPEAFMKRVPGRWRFVAEVDVALDWLRVWTGKDQVAVRGKRLISRFRVDDGGTALYHDFRLHIPRKEMQIPPHHGPYSHEASHGFIGFPAICPTGRYAEGLTEVSRVAYWWFLGVDDAWRPFAGRCLGALRDHYDASGELVDVPSYAAAAGVYLVLQQKFCSRSDDDPGWMRFATLFRNAARTEVPRDASPAQRFALLVRVSEETFGKDAGKVLETLRLPPE